MIEKSLDEMIEMYRNGYTLDRYPSIYPDINKIIPYSPRWDYKFMGTCANVTQGETKDITISIGTAGTPPYTYKLYRDSTLIDTYGPVNDTTHVFSHKFDETKGTYTLKGELVDGCSKVVADTCSVTVDGEGGGAGLGMIVIGAIVVAGALYLVTKK